MAIDFEKAADELCTYWFPSIPRSEVLRVLRQVAERVREEARREAVLECAKIARERFSGADASDDMLKAFDVDADFQTAEGRQTELGTKNEDSWDAEARRAEGDVIDAWQTAQGDKDA